MNELEIEYICLREISILINKLLKVLLLPVYSLFHAAIYLVIHYYVNKSIIFIFGAFVSDDFLRTKENFSKKKKKKKKQT